MSTPAEFFRACGLLVDAPANDGRWHRVATEDHPRKKNGAYRWDGDVAFCQNWATMQEPASWRDATVRTITAADRAAQAQRHRDRQETQEKGWARAAEKARQIIATCRPGIHGYLHRKGFPEAQGLVTPDAALFVPMRTFGSDDLRGGQLIRWLAEPREWEKKFLPGMRAGGACFKLGRGREAILCEGLATGLSLELAAHEMRLSVQVVVCFSAHNIVVVAERLKALGVRSYTFADHDKSGAGAAAAEKAGLPWVMSPIEGEDANDLHQRAGLRTLAGMLLDLRKKRA